MCILVLCATVYNLWRNRNELKYGIHPKRKKIFSEKSVPQFSDECHTQKILCEVCTRVLGRGRFKKNQDKIDLCWNWSLKEEVLL
jgi:hypothetical protein